MNVVLRPAIKGDAVACAKIIGDWFADTPFVPRLHTAAEDLGFLTHVISTQDVTVAGTENAIGFIAVDGDELNLLYVDESSRGQGVGAALLAAAKEKSTRLELWTFQENKAARRFYERAGFQAVEMTDGAGNEEKVPDARYVWKATT